MATHSSILAWEILWTEEPDRLQSMGLQKSWPKQWVNNQSPGRSVVKNLPANVGDAGDMGLIPVQEDALEDKMATDCNVLAWKIPWTKKPGGLHTVHGVMKESDMT